MVLNLFVMRVTIQLWLTVSVQPSIPGLSVSGGWMYMCRGELGIGGGRGRDRQRAGKEG